MVSTVLIYVFFVLLVLVSFFSPKSLSRIEIYATSFFSFTYGMTTDMIFDLHYNYYGYFEEGFQWLGLVAIILYFPSVNFLFLNYYPINQKIMKKAAYILTWSIFSLAFEWAVLHTDFYYQIKWRLIYSAISYPMIFIVLALNLKFIRTLK